MDDIAICQWRSLEDIYKIATSGQFGQMNGTLKPFEKLKKTELQLELNARKMRFIPHNKKRSRRYSFSFRSAWYTVSTYYSN